VYEFVHTDVHGSSLDLPTKCSADTAVSSVYLLHCDMYTQYIFQDFCFGGVMDKLG